MPKKAGPKRIEPDTFVPMVLTAVNSDFTVIVCLRRWLRGPNVIGGSPEAVVSSEFFSFPVAIVLAPKVEVMTGFVNRDLTWAQKRPEDHGISEKCAKIALAEAWHAVRVTLDLGTMSLHVSSKIADWAKNKNGVRMRHLVSALRWDSWNAGKLTVGERARLLNDSGYPCSERQLERFMNDHGLSVKKAK